MLSALHRILGGLWAPKRKLEHTPDTVTELDSDPDTDCALGTDTTGATPQALSVADTADQVVPFDEHLLEKCRVLWQRGDWEGLTFLERDTVQHHPDRPRLALLAAAAHQQTGRMDEARMWLRLARDWGCSKQLISQIMISGVYNTLARASVAVGQLERAQLHFEEAMRSAIPKGNVAQLTQARIATQLPAMGLPALQPPTSPETETTDSNTPPMAKQALPDRHIE